MNQSKIHPDRKSEIYKKLLDCFIFDKNETFSNPNETKHILSGKEDVVVFGAGGFAIDFMLRVVNRNNLRIKCFVDNKFSNREKFFGYDCMNFQDFLKSNYYSATFTVIVCVYRNKVLQEILSLLKNHGIQKILVATDIYDMQLIYPPKTLLDNHIEYYQNYKEDILSAYHLFNDEISCESYLRCMQTHLKRKLVKMIEFPEEDQYLPCDINLKRNRSRVINCGAYDGDTIRKIVAKDGKIEALACFEPNLNTFELLSSFVNENILSVANDVSLFPCGVDESNKLVKFSQNGASSSTLSASTTSEKTQNETYIPVVKIDSVLPNFGPTYINMDIEGAELNALRGAEKTIAKFLPDLAICVYHTPSHYWEIPLFLSQLHPGYKLYLRNYTYFTNESVLYATT